MIEKQRLKDILFWAMCISVIVLCVFLIYHLNKGSLECLTSPIQYGIKSSNTDMTCTCSIPNSNQFLFVTKYNSTLFNY